MNTTILKERKRLSLSLGSGPSPRKVRLVLTLELEGDDEGLGDSASDDSAIESRPSSSASQPEDAAPAPLSEDDVHPQVAAGDEVEVAGAADEAMQVVEGVVNEVIDAVSFRAGLVGCERRTSSDVETNDVDDDDAMSEASTHDDDPRDWTVRTGDLDLNSADTTIDWYAPGENEEGVVASRVRRVGAKEE